MFNPFAALLLVPALHLWLWLAQPGVRSRRWSIALLLLVGIAPGVLVLFYYAKRVRPLATVAGLEPCADARRRDVGCGRALLVRWRSAACRAPWSSGCARRGAAATAAEAPVTVRGPASYAGPGSLGGTKSALRR